MRPDIYNTNKVAKQQRKQEQVTHGAGKVLQDSKLEQIQSDQHQSSSSSSSSGLAISAAPSE